MNELYIVAVNFPSENSNLIYFGGEECNEFEVGSLVSVPLGKRKEKGVVLKRVENPGEIKIRPGLKVKKILGKLNQDVLFKQDDLKIFEWAAKYYHYSMGKLIFDCLPNRPKREKVPLPIIGKGENIEYELSAKQREIINEIKDISLNGHARFLIHGVTGSGKTSIYLEVIKEMLSRKKSVLFLLPEINLTPQFLKVFETYLNAPIYSYHSEIKGREKYGLWKLLINDDTPKVIVGTRSSIFLPISGLGLIVVDEEHDLSFKQEDRCPYSARDLAIIKSKFLNIPVVLGSATPSLEIFHTSQKQFNIEKINSYYFSIKERAGKAELPIVEIIDEKIKEQNINSEYWPLHSKSIQLIQETIEKGEQVLVFLNRLGFSSFIQCKVCAQKFTCVNCSTNLRYFKKKGKLSCQFCNFEIELPEVCTKCGCLNLYHKGYGTEKVVEVLKDIFPKRKIDRFDRDEIRNMGQLNDKLEQFHRHEIDVLVGTQMLSKGHNFKKVGLVLILGIDSQLNFPDFRSNEKVFQTLTQVAGRSGRFGGKSKVAIQTFNPDNDIFSILKNHDYWNFYFGELEIRKECFYPPFTKIAVIYIFSKHSDEGLKEAYKVKNNLDFLVRKHFCSVIVTGPKSTIVEKRVNQFSWCIMLKSDQINDLHNLIRSLSGSFSMPSHVKMKIDIDPLVFQ